MEYGENVLIGVGDAAPELPQPVRAADPARATSGRGLQIVEQVSHDWGVRTDGPGKEVPDGTPGELVATAAFPNVPVFLWGDKTPAGVPGSKYHSSYFARFDHVVSDPRGNHVLYLSS